MKKFLSVLFIAALAISLSAVTIDVMNMTEGRKGNQKVPAVAENTRGERVYVFRGGDFYVYYRLYKNGSWGKVIRMPGSPIFRGEFWYTDIVADHSGAIHYVCEETDSHMWYTYFKNGVWATMRQIDVPHEATLSIAVRSDDTVVLAAAMKTNSGGLTKDVVIGTKTKDQTNFTRFVNVTKDQEASTMVDLAIDAKDNSWLVWKDEIYKNNSMPVSLVTLNKDHKQIYYKNVSGVPEQRMWCWYGRIAINSEGKVMVTWFTSQALSYFFRSFDPKTETWSEIKPIIHGPLHHWPEFYNQVLARGTDFYWIGMTPDRLVKLYIYDAPHNSWTKVGDVSTRAANWFNASNGADSILLAWDTNAEPMSSYLTTVAVKPVGPLISGKVQQDSKGISGVALTGFPGIPTTDSSGNYGAFVENGWTGTVKPYKSGYRFLPPSKPYDNVTSNQTGQDYTAITQFDLTISSTSGGTTTPPPATYPKDLNSLVTVTAIPDRNYQFVNWTGDASGSSNPMTLTIKKSIRIRANFIRIKIKSVANLNVVKRVERGFFSGYTLNALTWQANPENAEMGLAVSVQRVYRKARTEDNTKWARIAELENTVVKYEDRNLPEDSDYIYAVACVDDKGNESPVY